MIDEKLTKDISNFLAIEKPTDEEICSAANILLRIDRNQVLHMNICRKPQDRLEKLRYELGKHLKYRLDGLTLSEVHKLEEDILPKVEAVVVIPNENTDENENDIPAKTLGRRSDHDELPKSIQEIWEVNGERWKKMKDAYYTCQMLTASCDRYEYLKILSETYREYKEDMKKYDDYVIGTQTTAVIDAKAVTSARAFISRNRPVFDKAKAEGNENDIAELRSKIQQRVDILTDNNAAMSPALEQWLHDNDFVKNETSGEVQTTE